MSEDLDVAEELRKTFDVLCPPGTETRRMLDSTMGLLIYGTDRMPDEDFSWTAAKTAVLMNRIKEKP